jgi:hypothetical protein
VLQTCLAQSPWTPLGNTKKDSITKKRWLNGLGQKTDKDNPSFYKIGFCEFWEFTVGNHLNSSRHIKP